MMEPLESFGSYIAAKVLEAKIKEDELVVNCDGETSFVGVPEVHGDFLLFKTAKYGDCVVRNLVVQLSAVRFVILVKDTEG
jgi:hypothetical protein